jgi:hypothetical protein
MRQKIMPGKGENSCPEWKEKLENDEKWCTFACKRAIMGKKQTIIDEKALEQSMNPFSQELRIEVSTRLDPEAKVIDEFGSPIPASSVIEKARSTKIYQTAELRNRTMGLSATAMRMLWFISYEMEPGKDWIDLDPEWYKEAAGNGSRNMYKKGTTELMRYGYITPTMYKNVYWINPVIMFNGNRVKKYPDKVIWKNTYTGKPQPKRKPPTPKDGINVTRKVKVTMDEKNKEMNTNG